MQKLFSFLWDSVDDVKGLNAQLALSRKIRRDRVDRRNAILARLEIQLTKKFFLAFDL